MIWAPRVKLRKQCHGNAHSLRGRHILRKHLWFNKILLLLATTNWSCLRLRIENHVTTTLDVVNYGHSKLWRPLAMKRGSCDFKDIMEYDHNELWRLLATKVLLISRKWERNTRSFPKSRRLFTTKYSVLYCDIFYIYLWKFRGRFFNLKQYPGHNCGYIYFLKRTSFY